MTLTLADLDRWGPTPSIVCSRPRSTAPTGVRSTATQIGDVMAPTLWEGDSHDAAMGATGRIQDDLLNHADEDDIADILYQYGEEYRSRRVARAIVRHRERTPFATTWSDGM